MKKILLILGSTFLPVLAFAQDLRYVDNLAGGIFNIVSAYIIPGLTLAASAFFIWGIIQYIRADSSENKAKARHSLIQGVIALAVLVSVWGIVNLLQRVFQVNPSSQTNTVCPPGYTAYGAYCRP